MDKPISVGDLVQVIRECCEPGTVRGSIGIVSEISRGYFECEDCSHEDTGAHAHIEGLATSPDTEKEECGWVPVSWLKRIPPLSELEGEKRDEEIPA